MAKKQSDDFYELVKNMASYQKTLAKLKEKGEKPVSKPTYYKYRNTYRQKLLESKDKVALFLRDLQIAGWEVNTKHFAEYKIEGRIYTTVGETIKEVKDDFIQFVRESLTPKRPILSLGSSCL